MCTAPKNKIRRASSDPYDCSCGAGGGGRGGGGGILMWRSAAMLLLCRSAQIAAEEEDECAHVDDFGSDLWCRFAAISSSCCLLLAISSGEGPSGGVWGVVSSAAVLLVLGRLIG